MGVFNTNTTVEIFYRLHFVIEKHEQEKKREEMKTSRPQWLKEEQLFVR